MRTTTTRALGALALLITAAAVVPAAASPSSSTAGQRSGLVLRGLVSMSSTGSSFVLPVVLSRPVRISQDTDTGTKAARGRFVGFILRKDGPGTQPTASDIVAHGCLHRGCRPPHWPFFDDPGADYSFVFADFSDPTSRTGIFPPGGYHLFVIADGAPMQSTLRLHGLAGHVAVSKGAPLPTTTSMPAPSVYSPPAGSASPGNLYSAGDTHHGASDAGYYFHMLYKLKAVWGEGTDQMGLCYISGRPEPNGLGPYEYPCANPSGPLDAVSALSDIGSGIGDGSLPTDDRGGPAGLVPQSVDALWTFGLYPVQGRVLSLGGYINTESPAVQAHSLTFWLDFTGDELRGPAFHWNPPTPRP